MGVEDVSRAYTLFLDVQRSTQYLVDNADQVRLLSLLVSCSVPSSLRTRGFALLYQACMTSVSQQTPDASTAF